jgi:class 3 adenylate cyclase
VLCLDIVEYSQHRTEDQSSLIERFKPVLTEAIAGIARDDLVVLDTGGGVTLTFLGDPEDALVAGIRVGDALARRAVTARPRLQIRVGINLGPVRLIKDLNAQPNIIGDGINVARSIVKFAEPGQILLSRSYYDVMARLSKDFAKLCQYQGAKTGKDLREHEVYAVSTAQRAKRGWTTAIVAWMRNLLR